MVYLLKNNKKSNNFKKEVIFFIIIILLFVFGQFSFLNKSLTFIVGPLGTLKNNSIDVANDFFSFLSFKKSLVEENNSLKERLFKDRSMLANVKILGEENLALKKILGRLDLKTSSSIVLANVILKPALSIYNSLILDVGENYKIKKGDKVFVENVIIGEIEELYSKTSKVKLYSFPKDKVEVVVGFNKILTTAEGKGDGIFEIKLPQEVDVNKGDIVTFPGTPLKILAVVEDIITNPEDPFETILAKSPVNFFELRWVQIIQD